jgi:V/A-type H+-transporting ATPase subunit E
MATDSLTQVIQKLKKEGIESAETEAAKIKQSAEAEAKKIIAAAEEQAKNTLNKAENDADQLRSQLKLEMQRAAKIGLEAFKASVEKALVIPTINSSIGSAMGVQQLLEQAVIELIKGFAAQNFRSSDLTVILPKDLRGQVANMLLAKMKEQTEGDGIEVQFDDDLRFGLKIGPTKEGFVFDLGQDGFREMFTRFIAPQFRSLFIAKSEED